MCGLFLGPLYAYGLSNRFVTYYVSLCLLADLEEKASKVVAYAYFFVLDFFVNILYTIMFASMWFLFISEADKSASFSNTENDLRADAAKSKKPVVISSVAGESDSDSSGYTFSTISIAFFWLVKVYFILIVFSYARSLVIRARISAESFSSSGSFWEKTQNWMLRGNYWKEDEEGYKQVSHMTN
jgi:hypothetical protein